MESSKTVIAVCGPTASGKTNFAVGLAARYNTDILSCDSRQCYRELNIGVAKPSAIQLAEVRHWFIDAFSIFDQVDARMFESYAQKVAQEVFSRHDTLIVAGGTGLYIKAFLQGLDEIPAVDQDSELMIRSQYEQHGIGWLSKQLHELDPLYAAQGEMQNPHRMMRALGVVIATGQSILTFHTGGTKQRDFRVEKIFLNPPRALLYNRINERVDQMMNAGLLEEVRTLYPLRKLNSLQTVGYQELFDYLDGMHTLEEAVALIKRNSRRYAKRQLTWFTKYFVDSHTEIIGEGTHS